MTNPLGQGSSSWARTTRFAELEWGMSRKKVLSMFPAARTYPGYEGHNPRTGERVTVRESVVLASSPPPVPDLPVYGMVTFDTTDHLDTITLKSAYPRPPEVSDTAVLQAANKVRAALGAEAWAAVPAQPTSWKHKATHVDFRYDDDCFWFELSPAK